MSSRKIKSAPVTKIAALQADADMGPQRNAIATRAKLLSEAQSLFGSRGYSGVGLREIASGAGVDPSLVKRYFGSKRDLFFACLEGHLSFAPWTGIDQEFFAKQVVNHLINKDDRQPDALLMLLLAAGDSEVGADSVDSLNTFFVAPLARWLKGSNRQARAAAITALLSGAWIHRRPMPIKCVANVMDPWFQSWLEKSIHYLVIMK